MIYGYLRVSTAHQTVENQKFEISNYLKSRGVKAPVLFIEEIKSGTIDYKKRSLGKILKKIKEGDLIICSELSRLGRSMFMVMEILNLILAKKVRLITIKENFVFDETISSKVISFAFSLAAEIERNLISQRTKEALALRKARGMKLGRPFGSHNKHYLLDTHETKIRKMIENGQSLYQIAKKYKCQLGTLINFVKRKEINYTSKKAFKAFN